MYSRKSNTPIGSEILSRVSTLPIRGFFLEFSDGLCLFSLV